MEMAEFNLKIYLDNAVFKGSNDRNFEVGYCLQRVRHQLAMDASRTSGPIIDRNGNKVGEWEME